MYPARPPLLATLLALSCPIQFLRAQESAPLVRSSTRLVLLDVVVTNKAGKPVGGLTKDDFTVYEDGEAQKITSFEAPSVETMHAAGSRTILLLDQLNIRFQDLAYARDQLFLFLEHNPIEHQPTALMSVGPHGLEMVQNFTSDSKPLKEKLLQLGPVTANPTDGYMDPGKSREHAQQGLGALTQIARAAVGSDYSLNVIWVTSGFSGILRTIGSHDETEAAIRRVANLLIRSRMRVYTINPAGVLPLAAIVSGVPQQQAKVAHESSAAQLMGLSNGQQAEADVILSHLTKMMGGLSYYRRNDIEEALGQAMLDASSGYALSYSPSKTSFDGSYRTIEVRTNLEGSSARTKQGYYAIPDESVMDPSMKEARLTTAMSSPLAYAGLNVTCPLTYESAKARLSGNLIITPKQFGNGDDATGQIIRVQTFSPGGKMLNSWSWQANWKKPWTDRQVTARFDQVIARDASRVRFVISDPPADRIGTCDLFLR